MPQRAQVRWVNAGPTLKSQGWILEFLGYALVQVNEFLERKSMIIIRGVVRVIVTAGNKVFGIAPLLLQQAPERSKYGRVDSQSLLLSICRTIFRSWLETVNCRVVFALIHDGLPTYAPVTACRDPGSKAAK